MSGTFFIFPDPFALNLRTANQLTSAMIIQITRIPLYNLALIQSSIIQLLALVISEIINGFPAMLIQAFMGVANLEFVVIALAPVDAAVLWHLTGPCAILNTDATGS